MLTHHAADDDSTKIVGRLTSVTQLDDGSAAYTADLADTDEARKIATLVDPGPEKGPAYLKGVSIRGAWVGKVRRQSGPNGAQVETADDLELDGLDFTRKPGVVGARVDSFTPEAASAPAESCIRWSGAHHRVSAGGAGDSDHRRGRHAEGGDASTRWRPVRRSGIPGGQEEAVSHRYQQGSRQGAWSYVNQADNARHTRPPS
jgi:hypothetical protein